MKLFALDLELNQPSKKIIQVGLVVGDTVTGEIIDELELYVDPQEPLDPRIITLTGITEEQIKICGISLDKAAWLAGLFIARHPGTFTNPLTWGGGDSHCFSQQTQTQLFGRRWVDVKTVHQTLMIARGKSVQAGLAKALTKWGLNFKGRKHNALDDAKNTFHLYNHLIKVLKTKLEE